MTVRTCANCVEIAPCVLVLIDGKMRPLCPTCRAIRPDQLDGPSGVRIEQFIETPAAPTYRPDLAVLDRVSR